MLKVIYILFLGVVLALFVGLGIQAFYPFPTSPEYPSALQYNANKEQTTEQVELQKTFDNSMKDYQKDLAHHSRNVSIIAAMVSILFMIISLTILAGTVIINDGVLLGGLLTMIYSIITGIMSTDNIFRFLVITFGLAVALVLGYFKFIKPKEIPVKR